MRRSLAVVALLLAGCGTVSPVGQPEATTPAPTTAAPTTAAPTTTALAPSTRTPYGDCPVPIPQPSGQMAAVDYVDFVQANSTNYVGGLPGKLTGADRGAEQFEVRCDIGAWSDAYGQATTTRDGDAAFLPAGTPVYAVNGWSPLCRLMAKVNDGWQEYSAPTGSVCKDPRNAEPPNPSKPPTNGPTTTSVAGCPALPPSEPGKGVAVDFGDIVQAHGRAYLRDRTSTLTTEDIGDLQFRISCSLSRLNDVTHQLTPAARDGDATFLPAGTPVYAVKGWSPLCRLIASSNDTWAIYVAHPLPSACPSG
jgi:hypothetical protein